MKKTKYTSEFKEEAVKQVIDKGHPVPMLLRGGNHILKPAPVLNFSIRSSLIPIQIGQTNSGHIFHKRKTCFDLSSELIT